MIHDKLPVFSLTSSIPRGELAAGETGTARDLYGGNASHSSNKGRPGGRPDARVGSMVSRLWAQATETSTRLAAVGVMGLASLCSACSTLPATQLTGPVSASPTSVLSIDEKAEANLLGGHTWRGKLHDAGRLVPLNVARPGAPTLITLHGINGGPDSLQTLHDGADRDGMQVTTYAYDSHFERLTQTRDELAASLHQWSLQHPGQTLTIAAHSSGGRLAVAALGEMASQGQLDFPVRLYLLAPVLEGFPMANLDHLSPPFIEALLPSHWNIVSGVDMGTANPIQHELNTLRLPPNVHTTLYIASNDAIVHANEPAYQAIATQLNCQQIVIQGADHNTIVDRVHIQAP